MFRYSISLILLLLISSTLWASASVPLVKHDLKVVIRPARNSIQVRDEIRLPAPVASVVFLLHAGLNPKLETTRAKLRALDRHTGSVPAQAYQVTFGEPRAAFALSYAGKIQHPLAAYGGDQSGREAAGTPGLIADEGVFLSASTLWYPYIDGRLVRFSLHISLPDGWSAVSQGNSFADGTGWEESSPQDDIYLVAGRYQVYKDAASPVEAQVYLRSTDAELAQRYLRVTSHYIDLYQRLIGPYPYGKFALVENFWESGYGMPSFTLLGPRVLRFPFILDSSYPHEILHNWWGNGVYVDYLKGNWSEGLTTYLADHLIKERRGEGSAYRRDTLQRYADFVHDKNDFPLTQFSGRHGDVSQAVGYGKTMMFFHMLRLKLGDPAFIRGLQRFYRDNLHRIAGFDDLKSAFERTSQLDLGTFFEQWITTTGAPELEISQTGVYQDAQGYHVQGMLHQKQAGRTFDIDVPIAIQTERDNSEIHLLHMNERSLRFDIPLQPRPFRLTVDPRFDLFRQLASGETPSSLSQLFGAERVTLILPSAASTPVKRSLLKLATAWSRRWKDSRIISDDSIEALPDKGGILLLGKTNRFAPRFIDRVAEQRVGLTDHELVIGEHAFATSDLSFALTAPHPTDKESAVGLFHVGSIPAIEGFARKLPHYGKYSYTVFQGDKPDNVLKGQWQTSTSALSIALTRLEPLPPARIPDHAPLADQTGL